MHLVKKSKFCSQNLSEFISHFESFLWVRIPPKSLTPLRFDAIISPYNRILFHPLRIFFRQTPPTCLRLTNKLKKQAIFLFNFIMYHNIIFQVKGDISRHHLSIAGASVECGISVSTIYRSSLKGTFPPKVKLCEGRVAFLVYQIEEWLQGKRGGWV